MYIAIDFDGTIVTHEYPAIGKDIGAIQWMKDFQEAGAKLILYTMRSGDTLQEAIEYCKAQGVEFFAHNDNPDQNTWTESRKVYANLYIDDAALGVPLKMGEFRPYVDWEVVGPVVLESLIVT
jgi:hypothetical protein